jgi:predicted NBD/HSP70 family sugar kinase
MTYLNISTGIGARVIYDGHLSRRSRSVSGEFGHFIIGIGVGSPLDSRTGVVFVAPYLPPFASSIEY